VPGIDETLRVNGTASLSSDPALLRPSAVNGKLPRMMVLVTVRQMFFHCGKGAERSRLWQDDYKVKRAAFPSLARVIIEQAKPAGVTVEEAEARVERSYKEISTESGIHRPGPVLAWLDRRFPISKIASRDFPVWVWRISRRRWSR